MKDAWLYLLAQSRAAGITQHRDSFRGKRLKTVVLSWIVAAALGDAHEMVHETNLSAFKQTLLLLLAKLVSNKLCVSVDVDGQCRFRFHLEEKPAKDDILVLNRCELDRWSGSTCAKNALDGVGVSRIQVWLGKLAFEDF